MKRYFFDSVFDFLWSNKYFYNRFDSVNLHFDFPDYLGLPKGISNRLSSEFVDAIQSSLSTILASEKAIFAKKYLEEECERLGCKIYN